MSYGLHNEITPYQDRELDLTKPVQVYRRLRGKGVTYSLKQGGRVVAHATQVMLRDVSFEVNETTRQWVIKHKRKQPHAFVVGTVVVDEVADYVNGERLSTGLFYNPYVAGQFLRREDKQPVTQAAYGVLNYYGLSVVLPA